MWPFVLALGVFIFLGLRGRTGGYAGPWIGFAIMFVALAPVSVSQIGARVGLPHGLSGFFADEPPPRRPVPAASYRIPVDADGHYRVDVDVNGSTVHMLVDTGASAITLSYDDARRLGLTVALGGRLIALQTANGIAYGAEVAIGEVRVGRIERRLVRAIVMQQGALQQSLLGMSFLNSLERYEARGGELILVE